MVVEQQVLQSLGFVGIFKNSFKIILSRKKLFAQLSLAVVLPLSFILLALSWTSQALTVRIINDSINRDDVFSWYPVYDELTRSIRSASIFLALSTLGHYTVVLFLYLLSAFVVTYAIACILTGRDVTFTKVASVVPKLVWKRLAITFLWSFAVFFAYDVLFDVIVVLCLVFINPTLVGVIAVCVLSIMYLAGFVYMAMIWLLATVASVLEDAHGRRAIAKGKSLMKGKAGTSVGCFLGLYVIYLMLQVAVLLVLASNIARIPFVYRIFIGLIFVFLLLGILLLGLVVQTVLYFVCKSFHLQSIGEPSFDNHLEILHGDKAYLSGAQNVQLEQIPV